MPVHTPPLSTSPGIPCPVSMTHTLNMKRPSIGWRFMFMVTDCVFRSYPAAVQPTPQLCSFLCAAPWKGSGSPHFQGTSSEENIPQQACARKHMGEEDACVVLQGSPAEAQRGKKGVLPSSLQFRQAGPGRRGTNTLRTYRNSNRALTHASPRPGELLQESKEEITCSPKPLQC